VGARERDSGASLVEFAIVLPLLIALLLGTIDFGWLFSQNHDLRSASREGARLAVVNSGTGSTPDARRDDLIGKTRGKASQLSGASLEVYIRLENTDGDGVTGGPGDDVVVCLRYPKRSVSGLFDPFISGTMTTKAIMRMEQPADFSSGGSAGLAGSCSS
jgi:hypothetical protein